VILVFLRSRVTSFTNPYLENIKGFGNCQMDIFQVYNFIGFIFFPIIVFPPRYEESLRLQNSSLPWHCPLAHTMYHNYFV